MSSWIIKAWTNTWSPITGGQLSIINTHVVCYQWHFSKVKFKMSAMSPVTENASSKFALFFVCLVYGLSSASDWPSCYSCHDFPYLGPINIGVVPFNQLWTNLFWTPEVFRSIVKTNESNSKFHSRCLATSSGKMNAYTLFFIDHKWGLPTWPRSMEQHIRSCYECRTKTSWDKTLIFILVIIWPNLTIHNLIFSSFVFLGLCHVQL